MSDTISLIAEVAPTGGIVTLSVETPDTTGTWTLTRAAANQAPITLYDGPASPFSPQWLDIGDGTNLPLNPATEYTYTFTSASGSTTAIVTPAATVEVSPDPYAQIMLRILQAGFASLQLPNGWTNRPKVIHAMPLGGTPTLPIVTMQLDLAQQMDVPIGHGLTTDSANRNFIAIEEIVHRRFRITVLTSTVDEREFYRDCVLAFFKSILVPVLAKMGNNVRHGFQAASSQVAGSDMAPGFYFCEIGLTFDGVFAVNLKTQYGLIETINIDVQTDQYALNL